jgi:hypothetical protein
MKMSDERAPWDQAHIHARKLEEALLEWGWREGSCSGDWSKESLKLQFLHKLAMQIVTKLERIDRSTNKANEENGPDDTYASLVWDPANGATPEGFWLTPCGDWKTIVIEPDVYQVSRNHCRCQFCEELRAKWESK